MKFLLQFVLSIALTSFACLSLNSQDIDFSQFEQIKPRNIGPAGMSGRVTAIDVDLSNKDKIFLGTASGGVWLSENGGVTWKPIFDEVSILSIGAIKINQSNPSEIWVGTGEGNPRNSQNSGAGVYRSLDGGKTWTFKGLKETRVIHRIVLDESRPGTVYVGAQGAAWGDSPDRGVFKSTDGGSNWDKILYVNEKTGVADMVMDPDNPNKLIVAMWEYGRKPWFFNSGGKGSGIHITHDGGANWKKVTSKDGLPKGDLGRIGVAIATSNTDVVYALVEAKENALYKSFDGGQTWKKHSTHEHIGNRPFYYGEIYVDPKNENRVYSIYTYVSMSEDGGKTFKIIADYGNNVHPDHHAFWIDPDDPSILIDGNDGGSNISYDMGKTWRFVNNLPVGQFYHVNVDDDFPYNVYGGMQDNGSWAGPSFALRSGGITNYDWQEVFFGDGFDVTPKPGDSRYVYAMSQGGNIGLVDKVTGVSKFLNPNNPDSTKLRFNWNAAFALEPNTECGLYFGSQFVHHSNDCGQSWSIMSPDLTTNDTSKHHQDISGGLTIDATNAENNTTIISIAPGVVDKNVIWVGSDDGRLHITTDGGSSWNDVYNRLPGAPAFGWIPQIEVNDKNAGEAFVVVNNYRLNDWSAYLYHTTDFGDSWARLVDDTDVTSFVTSITQDYKESKLLFLGTDAGLYISFDKGNKWHKWDKGLPSVQIRDMKIQRTFDDLVLGTFGRAFWVIDDIGAFRTYAQNQYTSSEFDVVSVSPGYLSERRSYQGIRFIAQAEFQGDNKGTNAVYSIWIKPDDKSKKDEVMNPSESNETEDDEQPESEDEEREKPKSKKKKEKDKLVFHVVDAQGDTIRTFSRKVDKKGLIRTSWNLEEDGVRSPSRRETKPDADLPGGSSVLPGSYKVIISYGTLKDSITTTVKLDPRVDITEYDLEALAKASAKYNETIKKSKEGFDRIAKAKKTIALIEKLSETLTDSAKVKVEQLTKSEKEKLEKLELLYFDKQGLKGIQRNPNNLNAFLRGGRRYIGSSYGEPGPNAMIAVQKAVSMATDVLTEVDTYFTKDWSDYKIEIEKIQFDLFR